MASLILAREISSVELMTAHIRRIEEVNPRLNAVMQPLFDSAMGNAREADARLARGEVDGPLHGVPVSIKDSIDVAGVRTTAGTIGRKFAPPAIEDATLVSRLRKAGAIPIAKTNLPDLLFAYETDNLIVGRTNNPYDFERTPGGSSGGESALLAAGGAPLGLGSDAAGSVRLPAAFCGIASIKPTSGRLPRTGHVPGAGLWVEALWQIGPMARKVEDLELAIELLVGEDRKDFSSPPAQLDTTDRFENLRIAFCTSNGFAEPQAEIKQTVERAAKVLADIGMEVIQEIPPGFEAAYDLEMGLIGADGGAALEAYARAEGSHRLHPILVNGFLDRIRARRASIEGFTQLWERWDTYRANLAAFFRRVDALICPVYTQTALAHGHSVQEDNFRGFGYTMAGNVGGNPAATVRCGGREGMPINVQIVTARWRDRLALKLAGILEESLGGWKPSLLFERHESE